MIVERVGASFRVLVARSRDAMHSDEVIGSTSAADAPCRRDHRRARGDPVCRFGPSIPRLAQKLKLMLSSPPTLFTWGLTNTAASVARSVAHDVS